MKPIRVGIIGVGGVAQKGHIPSYQKLKDVEVVAISDPNKDKMNDVAKRFNIPSTFKDYHSLLELNELDVVSVCSPNFFHAEHAIASFKAGKHVFCEKPVAMNSKEAEAVIREAKKSRRKFMVAFAHRFDLPFQVIKNFVDRGELGEIYYAKAGYLRRKGVPGLGSWFTKRNLCGGGSLLDIGIHMLDMSLWLMSNPEPALLLASTYDKLKDKAVCGDWPPQYIRK
jgi:predicted dehydrogenase